MLKPGSEVLPSNESFFFNNVQTWRKYHIPFLFVSVDKTITMHPSIVVILFQNMFGRFYQLL